MTIITYLARSEPGFMWRLETFLCESCEMCLQGILARHEKKSRYWSRFPKRGHIVWSFVWIDSLRRQIFTYLFFQHACVGVTTWPPLKHMIYAREWSHAWRKKKLEPRYSVWKRYRNKCKGEKLPTRLRKS